MDCKTDHQTLHKRRWIMSDETWSIRPAVESDLNFIYSSWLKSYRYGSDIAKVRNSIFYPEYAKVIDYILFKNDIKINMACKENDAGVVFGYCVSEPGVVHYVFVKQAFGNFGIARSLMIKAGPIEYSTHRTGVVTRYLEEHEIDYNPFLLFKQRNQDGTQG